VSFDLKSRTLRIDDIATERQRSRHSA